MAMNPIIKAQLKTFKEMNPSEVMDDSDLFEVMSIFSIENGVLGDNIDPFRAHLKGSEFGIDGVVITIQGTLCTDLDEADEILSHGRNHTSEFHFFQSKTSAKYNYGDVSKFLDAVYDFFTDQNLTEGEQLEDLARVKDAIYSNAAKNSPTLRCYYCTTGSDAELDRIQTLVDSNKERLGNLNIFDNIYIECVGAKIIQNGFRSATNSSTAKLNFPKAVTMPSHEKVDEAYIGYVSAKELLEIAFGDKDQEGLRHINRSLFYDNVRDFNPDSEINRSIIEELRAGQVDSFVFKNNGITVVSKSIDRKGDTFTLEDYQIVNGCQSTNILAYVGELANDVFVPLRLIGCKDADFVSSVIIGTNKQNEIREDQFWALRPFMKDLEEYCAAQGTDSRIYIERRDNQYRDVQVERTRIIKPTDLMKAVAAMYFHQPHRAARDYRGIRKEFSGRIFNDHHNVELYHLAGLALYKFDYLVRTGRVERAKAIFRFYALYGLVKQHWSKADLLNANSKIQSEVKTQILAVLNDMDKYAEFIDEVSAELERIISSSDFKSREKIRDFIRTESVVSALTNSMFPESKSY